MKFGSGGWPCDRCGRRLGPNDNFCPRCGKTDTEQLLLDPNVPFPPTASVDQPAGVQSGDDQPEKSQVASPEEVVAEQRQSKVAVSRVTKQGSRIKTLGASAAVVGLISLVVFAGQSTSAVDEAGQDPLAEPTTEDTSLWSQNEIPGSEPGSESNPDAEADLADPVLIEPEELPPDTSIGLLFSSEDVIASKFLSLAGQEPQRLAAFVDPAGWIRLAYDLESVPEQDQVPIPNGLAYKAAKDDRVEIRNGELGGVYQQGETGELEKVLDGTVLVSADDLLLVRRCFDRLVCSNEWYDRATFQKLDYPAVEEGDIVQIAGERWVVVTDRVRHVQTAQPFDAAVPAADTIGSSPDGRWIAIFDSDAEGRVKLFDTVAIGDNFGAGVLDGLESEVEGSVVSPMVYTLDLGENYQFDQITVVGLR